LTTVYIYAIINIVYYIRGVIMTYGWGWIAVIIVAIVAEVLTDQLISIWFVPGAIVAVILDFCNVSIL